MLHAVDGAWTVRYAEAVPRHRKAHFVVSNEHGRDAATVWPAGTTARLELPDGDLTWEAPSLWQLRLQYRIDELLAARTPWTAIGKGRPRERPFTVEVMPALTTRPDASLVLSLAAWLTWTSVSSAT
jgi:hypothetical protein